MAVSSLIVSVLALAVAIASAGYARRQVTAAEGAVAIERSRHREERRPRLSGKVEPYDSNFGRSRLVVTLESNEPLADIELTIRSGRASFNVGGRSPRHASWFGDPPRRVPSRRPDPPYIDSPNTSRINPRESMGWLLNLNGAEGILQLEATCHGLNGEKWESVPIEATIEQPRIPNAW
jgi:hypothetical protein